MDVAEHRAGAPWDRRRRSRRRRRSAVDAGVDQLAQLGVDLLLGHVAARPDRRPACAVCGLAATAAAGLSAPSRTTTPTQRGQPLPHPNPPPVTRDAVRTPRAEGSAWARGTEQRRQPLPGRPSRSEARKYSRAEARVNGPVAVRRRRRCLDAPRTRAPQASLATSSRTAAAEASKAACSSAVSSISKTRSMPARAEDDRHADEQAVGPELALEQDGARQDALAIEQDRLDHLERRRGRGVERRAGLEQGDDLGAAVGRPLLERLDPVRRRAAP